MTVEASTLPNDPVEVAEPLTVPLLSIVSVCGEVTLNAPNEPVDNAEPLINVPEPLRTVCATKPPLILAFSRVVVRVEKLELDSVIEPEPSNRLTLLLNEELVSVNEPLIVVFEVDPKDESQTPAAIVPTEVIFVCAAVTKVPLIVDASVLPNEPVEVALPLTVPLLSIVSVCGEVTLNEAKDPVESDEPLISVPEPLSTVWATKPPLILAFSSVVALVLNEELDSVIEPLPSSNPTLVENDPLSVCSESTLLSSVVTLVLYDDETSTKLETLIPDTSIAPNEPVEVVEPLT